MTTEWRHVSDEELEKLGEELYMRRLAKNVSQKYLQIICHGVIIMKVQKC
jgi:hypothetical protein